MSDFLSWGDYERWVDDLDFTVIEEAPFETIRAELEPVFENVRHGASIWRDVARDRHVKLRA